MNDDDVKTLYFQRFCDLNGNSQELQIGKRNGQAAPIFGPSTTDPRNDMTDNDENQELQNELCYGLNETERRTWIKIIYGQTLLDIAKDEGVRRTAVYSRIRGSRKSKGMIHKNFYVARWWLLRQAGQLNN
jgi:hypothetical protein